MIAMQYGFVLPADYDMRIVDRRIRDKGPLLDGFPRLRFKAYLSARKGLGRPPALNNLYAPFYLWEEAQGIADFLSGPGFAAVSRDFGRPTVRTWVVWQADLGSALAEARFASRRIAPIAACSDLDAMRSAAVAHVPSARQTGALAALAGFDPTSWSTVQFELWRTQPSNTGDDTEVYDVGHVSLPITV